MACPCCNRVSLKDAGIQRELAAFAADVMVVAAYGLILPQAVLQLPRHGCLNIHASLLPRWRGAAPIQRAILAGDSRNRHHHHADGCGAGYRRHAAEKNLSDQARDNAETLHDKLAALGAAAIVEALRLLRKAGVDALCRRTTLQATYAAKLSKAEAQIDWTDNARAHCKRGARIQPLSCGNRHSQRDADQNMAGQRACATITSVRRKAATARSRCLAESGKDGIIVACGAGSAVSGSTAAPGRQSAACRAVRAGIRRTSRRPLISPA